MILILLRSYLGSWDKRISPNWYHISNFNWFKYWINLSVESIKIEHFFSTVNGQILVLVLTELNLRHTSLSHVRWTCSTLLLNNLDDLLRKKLELITRGSCIDKVIRRIPCMQTQFGSIIWMSCIKLWKGHRQANVYHTIHRWLQIKNCTNIHQRCFILPNSIYISFCLYCEADQQNGKEEEERKKVTRIWHQEAFFSFFFFGEGRIEEGVLTRLDLFRCFMKI